MARSIESKSLTLSPSWLVSGQDGAGANGARSERGLSVWADEAWDRWKVLPRLASHKLTEIMKAAGCSKGYASGAAERPLPAPPLHLVGLPVLVGVTLGPETRAPGWATGPGRPTARPDKCAWFGRDALPLRRQAVSECHLGVFLDDLSR